MITVDSGEESASNLELCKNCSTWPTTNYEETEVNNKPTTGELYNECLVKEKAGDCRR